MSKKNITVGLVALLLVAISLFVGLFFGLSWKVSFPKNSYSKAAVAADAGKCSEIGRDILKQKGSAVDACIAALLCIGLMNAHSAGIGGGLFFNIYNASTGQVEIINARETAPRAATENMFQNNPELARKGALAIAVPGEIRGYQWAHKRYGKLPWKDLFEPSIKLAESGFPLGKALARAIENEKDVIENDMSLCEVFCNSEGKILKINEIIRFPKLAKTYRQIAEEGADVFYNGSLAHQIVKDIKEQGGIITIEDLQNYKLDSENQPLKFEISNYTMYVPSAPSSGAVLGLILNILEGYNLTNESVSTVENKILTYHRIIEAFRFAFAKRSKLGDPHFLNITNFIQNMTSEEFAEKLRSKISDDTTFPVEYYEPEYLIQDDHGTTHISILAEDGSAVSATSTINLYFGSKVRSNVTGIIFNNEMDDFSTSNSSNGFEVHPSPNNFIKPGKRPLSSMCPAILLDKNKKVKMIAGASGGTKITTAAALVILNTLFFKYDLKESVKNPRMHNQLLPNVTQLEDGILQAVQDGLRAKNHIIEKLPPPGAVVQAILHDGHRIYAECDERKGGYPAGY
ncbi:gamma-glutamyltransferase 1a isoform X1 [Polypterus senegalus]|uniref:gamma-glutamyltransferase 1a isoform X1 n=2 Tax=Polypterus senegalus TaxID=55291 RepID=UPI00196590EC|nr:gamma-glutamyltransferase 1a isoform X1 [Polypterus senegalus]XP_039627817.1 gamma-glutamyltransferase 1a isoform X1 [Polypterus senegalus]